MSKRIRKSVSTRLDKNQMAAKDCLYVQHSNGSRKNNKRGTGSASAIAPETVRYFSERIIGESLIES